MPYIKSVCIRSTPNRSLAYIANPEKTDNLLLVSGLNCSTVPAVAYLEMKTVFEEYSKHKFNEAVCKNEKTPVKAIHYIQSFRPTDNVSPEQAHAIAKEWAEAAFGTERQILVSTHLDKGHIHSHIIINTYDFNGVKFNDNQTTLAAVRSLSDTLIKINSKFLMYWLISNQNHVKATAQYTTLPILNNQTISSFCLVYSSSREEQQSIVDYLDTKCAEIDSIIADKKKQLETLDEYRKSLIYEYVTGKKEVKTDE